MKLLGKATASSKVSTADKGLGKRPSNHRPFIATVCDDCGLTRSIDGKIVVDPYHIEGGIYSGAVVKALLCLGDLANRRIRGLRLKRIEGTRIISTHPNPNSGA